MSPQPAAMDKIKVAKIDDVLCTTSKVQSRGTLHLTAHHLIFKFSEEGDHKQDGEMWVPYPLISLVTRMPQTLQGLVPLAFRCRTFETFTLAFENDSDASDVFESVRELTVAASIYALYAFDYQPKPPLETTDGWNSYNPREEFTRMGIGSRTKAWRFTDINKEYTFCSTYPARLIVPARISDATLTYAAKYRSKARIPALVYLHWANYGSITRSSQPMVGLTNNRSIQDEKLIEAIFQSHLYPDSALVPQVDPPRNSRSPTIYGATATNLIIDARPTTNAMVMSVKGAGTENMEYYKDGKKAYLGVDNIHVMRESLSKVAEALRDADIMATLPGYEVISGDRAIGSFVDRQALQKSGWLKHISAILDGTLIIVRNIHINSSHVLIHCSDGWDRTAQLSSLSQICLDPFYRTTRGFQILVEKDWLSFGHKFADRCGHLSSEKFFQVSSGEGAIAPGGGDTAQAFFASVQNKFTPQSHLKETSPVFHQFLECVQQLLRQFPDRFEFNERFLERLHYHLYSCQFGTFLFNCERERRVPEPGQLPPIKRTWSVWDYLNSAGEKTKFVNPQYDPSLNDRSRRSSETDMGVLLPDPKDVRFWHELYGRTDEEMNGRLVTSQAIGADVIGPVEGADDDPMRQTSLAAPITPLPSSPSPSKSPTPERRFSKLPYQPRSTPSRSHSLLATSQPPSAPSLDMSDSLSDTNRRPSASRADTFRAFESTSSTLSLHPTPPLRNSSPSSRAESRSAPPNRWAPDAGGVRSIWASFSSNATAAFSAVQEAVDGATKDLRGVTLSGQDQDKRSELMETSTSSLSRSGWNIDDGSSDAWLSVKTSQTESQNPWSTVPSAPPTIPGIESRGVETYGNPAREMPTVGPSFSGTHPGDVRDPYLSQTASAGMASYLQSSSTRGSSPSHSFLAPRSSAAILSHNPIDAHLPPDPSILRPPSVGTLPSAPQGSPVPTNPQPPPKKDDGADLDPLGVGLWS